MTIANFRTHNGSNYEHTHMSNPIKESSNKDDERRCRGGESLPKKKYFLTKPINGLSFDN